MTSRKAVLASALLLGVATGLSYLRYRMTSPRVLRVGYPFVLLRQDQKLLDPDNTEFAYQFYLLENLAAGLVRDSKQAPSGYEPCLAASWEQPSPTQWAFDLRPDISWSDGTPIEPADVAEHLEKLKRGKHRHIVYLKKLRLVTVAGRRLILDFSAPVNDGLIHELSLADAALLHPRNHDWTVTSGAFSVASYDPGKRLLLRRNPHYPRAAEYPEEVELLDFNMETITRFFNPVEIDLLKVPGPTFRAGSREVLTRAPQVMKGYPTSIYFLHFNGQKALWRDVGARRDFSRIVEQALSSSSYNGLERERQMVPRGFSGRLEHDWADDAAPSGNLKGKRIKVNLLPSFAEAAPLRDALQAAFTKAGAAIEFGSGMGIGPADKDVDAQLVQFSGNQRDAMGSWQFMFSPENGELAAFRVEIEPFIAKVLAAQGKDAREAALRVLHEHVLKQAYVVPLFIEPDVIASSKRVDLSRLNPFDMRLRFHEVQWK